ncbi:MAG: sugar ABC transporter ATP-binding protein [Phycisphaerales bacterium]
MFLEARHISKRFGITQALDDVSVSFEAGEVHALMGENGAGKSTLGKTIAGLYKQDSGAVVIDGRELSPGSIEDAFGAGVRIVHQELAQCPNLSVAENLSLHAMPSRFGLVDRRRMRERASRLLARLDPTIDVEAPLGVLSPGRRQIVQIASALDDGGDSASAGHSSRARVIVFDEPTSSLSMGEADRLMEIVRSLAGEGLTILYVSHRMGEIFQVCDRVTVLRDGRFVATNDIKAIDEPTLVEQMIGRRIETARAGEFGSRTSSAGSVGTNGAASEAGALRAMADSDVGHEPPGSVLLEVRGVSSPGKLSDVSLEVRAGEIVGIGGLVGAGRSEVLDAIFGLDSRATGTVRIDGTPVALGNPRVAIAAGVGYVPEDRRNLGLFFLLGIDENIVMPEMPRLARGRLVRRSSSERGVVREKILGFHVKTAAATNVPGTLSGGNQQKVLIARWMGARTRVLLLDEPTRGIDVGTKAEIYRLVREEANRGTAVLLVSSEMPELLALSDRVLVMAGGRITGELTGDAMTQTNILRLATKEEPAIA